MARKHDTAPRRSLLIDIGMLCSDYCLSMSTVARMVEEGLLPAPVRSGTGPTCKRFWRRAEIEAAISAWPRERAAGRAA